MYNSPDFLKLSVMLLLLLVKVAALDSNSGVDSSNGSSSSSGGNGSSGGNSSGTTTSSSGGSGGGGTNSGSDGVGGSNGPQQQQQQQLSVAISKLFSAGGWCHLPVWVVAATSLLDDDTFTSVICGPADSCSSSGSSQAAFRKVLASSSSSSSSIQGFTVLAQVITQCSCAWVGEPAEPKFWLDSWVAGGKHRLCMPLHMRQQRQQQLLLLQQMVWPLRLVLLNATQLYEGGYALVTSAAAEAAWCCCSCWLVLVKQPDDDADVGRWSTKHLPGQCLQQLTPELPLLQDCWLQLMQRQLLQGPDGGMLQQHVQVHLEGLRLSSCGCHHTDPGDNESRVLETVMLDCESAYSINTLLALLEPLTYFGALSVWEAKLPAVLLLLEVLLRKLALPVIICSSSSSSSIKKQSTGAIFMCLQCLKVLKALAKGKGAGLGLLRDLLQQCWQQQQGQRRQQQQQQQQEQQPAYDNLCRQLHALIISLVKQWTPGCFSWVEHMAFEDLMDLAANVAMAKATSLPSG
jgi:hypothetical protein